MVKKVFLPTTDKVRNIVVIVVPERYIITFSAVHEYSLWSFKIRHYCGYNKNIQMPMLSNTYVMNNEMVTYTIGSISFKEVSSTEYCSDLRKHNTLNSENQLETNTRKGNPNKLNHN